MTMTVLDFDPGNNRIKFAARSAKTQVRTIISQYAEPSKVQSWGAPKPDAENPLIECNGKRIHWGLAAERYGADSLRLLATGNKEDMFVPALMATGLTGEIALNLFYWKQQYEVDQLVGDYEYSWNGKQKKLTVTEARHFPEGSGAVALARNKQENADLIMTIDIGGGTSTVGLWDDTTPIYYSAKDMSGIQALIRMLRQKTNLGQALRDRNARANDSSIARHVGYFAEACCNPDSHPEFPVHFDSSGVDIAPYVREVLPAWFQAMLAESFSELNGDGRMNQVDTILLIGGGARLLAPSKAKISEALQRQVLIPKEPELANLRGAVLL